MIKDEEIDLTEYRDFNEHLTFSTRVGDIIVMSKMQNVLNRQLYGKFPWNVIPLQNNYKYDGLVALGNKEQRREAILSHYWGTKDNMSCDCCGRQYVKIPWKEDSGLCNKCRKTK